MHSMIHTPKTIRFMGVGQVCIGDNGRASIVMLGNLADVKRPMLSPPPALTIETSAGCYKIDVEPDLKFFKKAINYHPYHTRKKLICV